MNLIDKYEAYKLISHEAMVSLLPYVKVAYERAAMTVDQMPTVEAEPARHGRWISERVLDVVALKCSECMHYTDTIMSNYCPGCGAKMLGGD